MGSLVVESSEIIPCQMNVFNYFFNNLSYQNLKTEASKLYNDLFEFCVKMLIVRGRLQISLLREFKGINELPFPLKSRFLMISKGILVNQSA